MSEFPEFFTTNKPNTTEPLFPDGPEADAWHATLPNPVTNSTVGFYTRQTDAYVELLDYDLPRDAARGIYTASDNERVLFKNTDPRGTTRSVSFALDGSVTDTTVCSASAYAGCESGTKSSSVSSDATSVLFQSVGIQVDLTGEQQQQLAVFQSDLQVSRKADQAEFENSGAAYGCP
jgi:hypothetical protein